MFLENRNNNISAKKREFVELLEKLRLLAMEKLVKEE
jgi:hypothetical protein